MKWFEETSKTTLRASDLQKEKQLRYLSTIKTSKNRQHSRLLIQNLHKHLQISDISSA